MSKNTFAGLYDFGKLIGEGHYAKVRLATHVFTGEKVAVKIISRDKLEDDEKENLRLEVHQIKYYLVGIQLGNNYL